MDPDEALPVLHQIHCQSSHPRKYLVEPTVTLQTGLAGEPNLVLTSEMLTSTAVGAAEELTSLATPTVTSTMLVVLGKHALLQGYQRDLLGQIPDDCDWDPAKEGSCHPDFSGW